MSGVDEVHMPGHSASASARFIDQYLRRSSVRLTGLLLGQLDAFNRIGSTFGALESQRFCAQYFAELRNALPGGTPVIRLSARQFVILLAGDSIGGIMEAAARLAEDDRAHVDVGGGRFVVDTTVGVAVYPTHAADASSLLRRAELALKDALENEQALAMYSPDATRRQAALWKLESDFERAIQLGEIEVYFQPKIGLPDHHPRGVEALARWRSPDGNFVPPQLFVPLAQRSGAIVPMTWHVFDRIAASVGAWSGRVRGLAVGVNVAPQILTRADFFGRLDDLASAVTAAGAELVLELTEESLVTGDTAAMSCLERIRKLGIGLAIDDFGKGYSSLGYLKEIPATEVKIDKRFVSTAASDEKDQQIVRVIVELARAFEMSIVAEGVDSAHALRTMEALGCDGAQGFYIARPMSAGLVADWLHGFAREAARFAVVDERAEQADGKIAL